MQVFDYTIEYKPGSENIADSLSRLSCCHSQEEEKTRNVAEEYVRFIAQTATLEAMTTRKVEEHSHRDAELSEVRRCIREGVWNNKECVKYIPVREELCHRQSGFAWNSHCYSPKSETASTSYCTRGTCRNCCYETETEDQVWWPCIDKGAEQYVRSCHGCQLVGQATPPEPLMPTELPLGKWQDLSLDLLGPC